MTLLFYKRKANQYHSLLIILLSMSSLFANDSIPDHKFLEHCKKSDAYFLHSYTDVAYTRRWSKFKKQTSINNKLVINNSAGVEKYAFLNLTEFISNRLMEIKVRTLKADGTIVELDSSLVFRRKSKREKFGSINYPIPAVEPGDTIETSYVYNEYVEKNLLMSFVNLYSEAPSLKTEHTVRCETDLLIRYKTYNDFPEPQVVSNDTLLYSAFKMEKIKGLSENENICIPCELPYVYYSLENVNTPLRTWKDVYNEEFNIFTQPVLIDREKSSYYRRWKKKVIGKAKDSTKYYKFELLHKDILANFKMEPGKLEELIKSNGYFLKEKRLNPLSIRRLYRQVLEDLEIEYSAVFARSKRAGNIDPYYIRRGEYDHIFFAYNNDHGSLNLLYPSEVHYKYQINEIPTSLYNTEAVIAKPYLTGKIKKRDKFVGYDFKFAEADSVQVNLIKLPGMTVDHNYMKQYYYSNVDLKEKNISFKYRFSVSGGLSTDIRSFYDLLNQNKEMSDFYDALTEFEGNQNVMQVDSIISTKLKRTRPYTYSVIGQGTINEALTFLNDSIASISLDKLIQHRQIESDLDTIDLDYYLDYSYTDQLEYMLEFPCDIEVLGLDNNKISFKNEVGEYLFDSRIMFKNKLNILSNYKIIKDMVPKSEYKQLKEINKQLKGIRNKRLLIKLKNL